MNRDWKNELGHRTSKTPTCLLLNPDQSFDSFGYKALENYANLSSVFEEKEYLLFQHFKMCLHSSEASLHVTLSFAWNKIALLAIRNAANLMTDGYRAYKLICITLLTKD